MPPVALSVVVLEHAVRLNVIAATAAIPITSRFIGASFHAVKERKKAPSLQWKLCYMIFANPIISFANVGSGIRAHRSFALLIVMQTLTTLDEESTKLWLESLMA